MMPDPAGRTPSSSLDGAPRRTTAIAISTLLCVMRRGRRWRRKAAKMQARGDRDGLLRMLRHSDVVNDTEGRAHDLAAERRLAAAEALGRLPRDSAVVAGLVDALDDPAARVRLAAVRSR